MSELKWNHVRYILDIGDGTERYLEVCDYEDTGYMEFTLNEFRGGDLVERSAKFYDYDKGFDEEPCEEEDWKTCSIINVDLICDTALRMINGYKQSKLKENKTYEALETEARIKKLEWTIAEQQLEIERLRQKELELTKGKNNE